MKFTVKISMLACLLFVIGKSSIASAQLTARCSEDALGVADAAHDIGRDDRGENAQDHHHDHDFDQGETAAARRGPGEMREFHCSLVLMGCKLCRI